MLTGLAACSPAGGYDVRAVVLEADGQSAPGELLASGADVRTGSDGVTLGLMAGTVAVLGDRGALHLDRLRLFKEGTRTLGRGVDLTLVAGELNLLIAAPEEAAPTMLRLRTVAGEIIGGPGCLAQIRQENAVVQVLCARGELLCAGQRVTAGSIATFPLAGPPRPAAGDAAGQRGLLALLERGARMQALDLERQARVPGWRSIPR